MHFLRFFSYLRLIFLASALIMFLTQGRCAMTWMNAAADARLEYENEMAWRRRSIEERLEELRKLGPALRTPTGDFQERETQNAA